MKALRSKNFLSLMVFALALTFSGCANDTYPPDKLKDAILSICKTEYGIEELDVKIAGKTLGVYLPLKKLFATDFKEAMVSGKVRNLETLFEPSPEALEKVEDVLFSISRVLLSTEKPIDFYVLAATDTERTGLQLVLIGYVNDIKRVRIWDISRNEYRKRIIHELKLNQAVVWNQPVRAFFHDLGHLQASEILKGYFGPAMSVDTLQRMFLNSLMTEKGPGEPAKWDILDIRSISTDKGSAVVYTKTRPLGKAAEVIPPDFDMEFIFMISLDNKQARIERVIPFQYVDDAGQWKKISFPEDLQITKNLHEWKDEFPLEELFLGPFLAQQMTRRVEAVIAQDERIHNTFHEAKLTFSYEEGATNSFALNIDALIRDLNDYDRRTVMLHEDMLYLLNLASQEFLNVTRGYHFGDYDHLTLKISQDPNAWILGRDQLELFRRKKIDLQSLLSLPNL